MWLGGGGPGEKEKRKNEKSDAIIFTHNRVNESFSSLCLAALLVAWGYPRPPVFDGAGVPWVLTGTHQRDAPSRQDDGASERQPICGWCCHGRHLFTFYFHHTPSAVNACRVARSTRASSCNRVLVMVVTTKSSASAASCCPPALP